MDKRKEIKKYQYKERDVFPYYPSDIIFTYSYDVYWQNFRDFDIWVRSTIN